MSVPPKSSASKPFALGAQGPASKLAALLRLCVARFDAGRGETVADAEPPTIQPAVSPAYRPFEPSRLDAA